jgi:hypothetical protein
MVHYIINIQKGIEKEEEAIDIYHDPTLKFPPPPPAQMEEGL